MVSMEKNFQSLMLDIAVAYEQASHKPYRYEWRVFCDEILRQYRTYLVERGITVQLSAEQYASADEMFADIAERSHLRVFSGGQNFAPGHPLARPSGFVDSAGEPMSMNHVFRAVHDVMGHFQARLGFDHESEVEAYKYHADEFWLHGATIALPALFAETVGQVAWHYVTGEFVSVQEAKLIVPYWLVF